MAQLSTSVLAIMSVRSVIGIASLLVPHITTTFFQIPLSTSSTIVLRLFGSRDLGLVALVWMAKSEEARRTALLIGILVDSIDVLSTAACMLEGNLDLIPAAWVGGGAAGLVGLALLGLRR